MQATLYILLLKLNNVAFFCVLLHKVWLGIIISLLVAAIFLWLISYFESRNFVQPSKRRAGWFSYFWFLFRVAINRIYKFTLLLKIQSNVVLGHKKNLFESLANRDAEFSLAKKLVVAVWCLIAVVFVNSYTSSLVSYLTAPRFVPLINTVQDLADSRELQVSSLKFTSIDSTLLVSIYYSRPENKREL